MTSTFKDNTPEIWLGAFPKPVDTVHKYDRGHAVVFAAPELTGATRLAASAASRIGAGLVTVVAESRGDVFRACLPADIMVVDKHPDKITEITAMLGGPGGLCQSHRAMLFNSRSDAKRVFDASTMNYNPFDAGLDANCVLTPHEGEFKRLFPDLSGDRPSRAIFAAKHSRAVVLLKGPQTVIAHPDGRIVVNDAPNPNLAKAGTGDVLAGFVTGLLAQGMPVFEACCAAVWIHSDCAERVGPGLTAVDLEYAIPECFKDF